MAPSLPHNPGPSPFDLADAATYESWRERKLAEYPRRAADLVVEVDRLGTLSESEKARCIDLCRRANMAVYAPRVSAHEPGDAETRLAVRALAATFGLGLVEDHRSAETDGLVAIEVTDKASKRGFIPYSTKPISWHTDGYYNAPGEDILAMLLHCARAASEGGENALLDPEIAYIRLRDRGPALVAAMMHPEAMTIPESLEEDGRVRPTSTGPVFFIDGETRSLAMRYTARARNIAWRDDADTLAAVAELDRLLRHEEEPLILKHRLSPGQGLVCNNVLHTRTGFANGEEGPGRLLYRARYRRRIAGSGFNEVRAAA